MTRRFLRTVFRLHMAALALGMIFMFTVSSASAQTDPQIGNFVWEDLNGDGIQNNDEPGIEHAAIYLYESDGVTVITYTHTDADGAYSFSVSPGAYVLGFVIPPGGGPSAFRHSPQNVGDDATDSDADTITGKTAQITVGSDEVEDTIDAGFYRIDLDGGVVCDVNQDGFVLVDDIVAMQYLLGDTVWPPGLPYSGDINGDGVISIDDMSACQRHYTTFDFGDAPTAAQSGFANSYPTTSADDGAGHAVTGPFMGAAVDAETDGQPTTGADGDDTNGDTPDDEDGVTFTSGPTTGTLAPSTLDIDLTNSPACTLNAWMDFNYDGDWDDSGEQIFTNQALVGGQVNSLTYTVPIGANNWHTYARFRCSTQADLGPTGLASDGEVEDYPVTIILDGNSVCDMDMDGFVLINDLETIYDLRGTVVDPAGAPHSGDSNVDGVISIDDFAECKAYQTPADWGDAPTAAQSGFANSYPTALDGGAYHVISGPFMGAAVDSENVGMPTVGADGDDVNGDTPDDEDGVTFTSGPTTGTLTPSTLDVDLTNSPACTLNGWMDFNYDGDWDDSGEQIFTNQALVGGQVNSLSYAVPIGTDDWHTYARFRCSTQADLGPTGLASDGEVEDYPVTIVLDGNSVCDVDMDGFVLFYDIEMIFGMRDTVVDPAGAPHSGDSNVDGVISVDDAVACQDFLTPTDWGDAPTAAQSGFANSYPTTPNDGAYHIISGPFMGAAVDSENVGQPTVGADGDDVNGDTPDDEDGVTFTSLITPGESETLDVDLSNSSACLLNAWIDFNLDGDWADNGEQIFTNQALTGGQVNSLSYAVPGGAATGITYARFRCSTQADLSYEGAASDGEVEDYKRWVGSSQQQVCVDVLSVDDFVAATPSDSAPPLTAGADETVDDYASAFNSIPFILGSERDVQVENLSTTAAAGLTIDGNDSAPFSWPGVGSARLTTAADDGAEALIQWDGVDGSMGRGYTLNTDLTYGGAVYGISLLTNSNVASEAEIRFYTESGSNCSVATITIPATYQYAFIPFPNNVYATPPAGLFGSHVPFSLSPCSSASADFTDIDAIELRLNTAATPAANIEMWFPRLLQACEFGDLPDGNASGTPDYNTLTENNGPSHPILDSTALRIGDAVDKELTGSTSTLGFLIEDGQPTAAADGDDANGDTPDDEEGVTLPTFTVDESATVAVKVTNTTGGDATLYGFIDFNGNGDFGDAGETVTANVSNGTSGGTVDLVFNVPGDANTTQPLGARFRLSTDDGLTADGPAPDGEVEDYLISVIAYDWGDLPDATGGPATGNPYPTLLEHDGARHIINDETYLGARVDAEDDGQPTAAADGDDNNDTSGAGDDEDGVTFNTGVADNSAISVCSVMTIDVTGVVDFTAITIDSIDMADIAAATIDSIGGANNTNPDGFLNAWIDWNGDGDFDDTVGGVPEQIVTDNTVPAAVTGGVGDTTLSFPKGASTLQTIMVDVPEEASVGQNAGMRFRFTRGDVLNNDVPTGEAVSGEVEDYILPIVDCEMDYGDAPTSAQSGFANSYPTTSADNGAVHAIAGPFMGAAVDAETDGQPTTGADGDDTNGDTPDDEDGVTFTSYVLPGSSATVDVDLSNSAGCTLNAWMDFNRDGDWADNGEQIFTNQALVGGQVNSLSYAVPGGAATGITYARFRCSTQADLSYVGEAPDGEVEDYLVNITDLDYGDAPDTVSGVTTGDYNTVATDSGPNHVIVSGLNLGSVAPDPDPGTLQDTAATADDASNTGAVDDEDGIATLPTITTSSTSVSMSVGATNSTATPAGLVCYIDFNRNGDFTDAGERSATVTVPANSGTASYNVSFNGFVAPTTGTSYIRCRIAYVAAEAESPTGPAASGEVEDFQVDIADTNLSVSLGYVNSERDDDGMTRFIWETATENGVAGFNLYMEVDGQQSLVNAEMIPSSVIDSVTPTAYAYEANVAGDRFYIELVYIAEESKRYGPFAVGDTYGSASGSPLTPGMMEFPLFLPTISGR